MHTDPGQGSSPLYYPRRHSRRRGYMAFSRVCLSACLFVRALTGKRLELSTPNLVLIYSIAVARHALTQRSIGQRSRSRGYEKRHGCMVVSDACCNSLCCGGRACWFDCLCFLVLKHFKLSSRKFAKCQFLKSEMAAAAILYVDKLISVTPRKYSNTGTGSISE